MKIRNTALSRFNECITLDADVLESYVKRVENDVLLGIESYKEKINVIYEEEIELEHESYVRIIEECEGLDSETYSFKAVFEEYFPRLQRASALIALCSFFEFSLNRLCDDLQQEKSIMLSVRDINGKGTYAALKYLIKVVGLEIDKGTRVYNEIQNIQNIRNNFVHQDGMITERVKDYVSGNEYLSGERKIKIESGYLLHILNTHMAFLKTIYDSLDDFIRSSETE
jgi:hypothetical protein